MWERDSSLLFGDSVTTAARGPVVAAWTFEQRKHHFAPGERRREWYVLFAASLAGCEMRHRDEAGSIALRAQVSPSVRRRRRHHRLLLCLQSRRGLCAREGPGTVGLDVSAPSLLQRALGVLLTDTYIVVLHQHLRHLVGGEFVELLVLAKDDDGDIDGA